MRERYESALKRRAGLSEAARVRLNAELARKTDWWGVCPRCGLNFTGTPEQLIEHRCQEPADAPG